MAACQYYSICAILDYSAFYWALLGYNYCYSQAYSKHWYYYYMDHSCSYLQTKTIAAYSC